MSPVEEELLRHEIAGAASYLEWGMGGSTLTALELVAGPIMSIESDPTYIAAVRGHQGMLDAEASGRLTLVHVDVGPVGPWGFPRDLGTKPQWSGYAMSPWRVPGHSPSRILVDGRFRVACVAATILHGPVNARILLHDYNDGHPMRNYEVVESIARLDVLVGTLAVFVAREDVDRATIEALLARSNFNPA
ncbi:MAG: hypothetical protein ACRCWO_11075 [Bosea sp. (in: a-proteobacteria)]